MSGLTKYCIGQALGLKATASKRKAVSSIPITIRPVEKRPCKPYGDSLAHEYELLKAFITHSTEMLTNRMLLRGVWGPDCGAEAHYHYVYVARLRKKIEADPQKPRYQAIEPGVGLRLLTEEA